MSATAKIVKDNRSVIIYQRKTINGRQELEVRNLVGEVMFSCRRLSGLRRYLMRKKYNPHVYDELPKRTQQDLDEYRAAEEQGTKLPSPPRVTLGQVFGDILNSNRSVA